MIWNSFGFVHRIQYKRWNRNEFDLAMTFAFAVFQFWKIKQQIGDIILYLPKSQRTTEANRLNTVIIINLQQNYHIAGFQSNHVEYHNDNSRKEHFSHTDFASFFFFSSSIFIVVILPPDIASWLYDYSQIHSWAT